MECPGVLVYQEEEGLDLLPQSTHPLSKLAWTGHYVASVARMEQSSRKSLVQRLTLGDIYNDLLLFMGDASQAPREA
jgi:hypothetical protein